MIYEYECLACKSVLEVEQSIKADCLEQCPECGALALRRMISKTSFVLKGNGWARDLYSKHGMN